MADMDFDAWFHSLCEAIERDDPVTVIVPKERYEETNKLLKSVKVVADDLHINQFILTNI